jgi:hypothetical protein
MAEVDMKRRAWVLPGLILILLAIAACGGAMSAQSAPAAEASTASGGESITNNQEAGVDEGGIVKAVGDTLVVLRRGRLFTIDVGGNRLQPICMVNAYVSREHAASWYDELLVHERHVVVIGYSYQYGGTELGLFELDPQGCVSHRGTYYLRSNDYYSSRNYASRLVDGKLVFYLPHYLGGSNGSDPFANAAPPAILRFGTDRDAWSPIVSRDDVARASGDVQNPTLHTLVVCDLEASAFACHAHGIIGEFGRTFYVSGRAVYVWTQAPYGGANGDYPRADVFRLPLDGGAIGATTAWGGPVDQFSFKEDGDVLNVLVRNESGGDWMANPESSRGDVSLAQIPIGSFTDQRPVTWQDYTALPRPEREYGAFQNRFVGDYVLYGTGTSWGYAQEGTLADLYAHPFRQDGETARLRLPHGVDRIEALGTDALVVGSDGDDLHMSTVALGRSPFVVDEFVRRDAAQGELRSHGFFFLGDPQSRGSGLLALPIRGNGAGYSWLTEGSVELVFLRTDRLRLSGLGGLHARNDEVDDQCVASCADWYGNARPIFYRGRIFALLGYEIVEGRIEEGRMEERRRIHLIRNLSPG